MSYIPTKVMVLIIRITETTMNDIETHRLKEVTKE